MKPVKLEITHQQTDDGSAIVALNGRLMLGPEGAQLEILVKDLLAKGIRKLVFDFTELSHIDSTGIGRCISSLNLIMKSGGKLAIIYSTNSMIEKRVFADPSLYRPVLLITDID